MNEWESGVLVLAAALTCIALGALVVRHQRRLRLPYSAPDGWGTDPDDRKWEREASALSHTSLVEVRETAKNWAASIGALLGVVGTITFVKGEDTFAKLDTTQGNFAFWLLVATALLAAAAIGLATFAAQGTPQRYDSLDGWTLSKITRERTRRATELLLWSRVLAIIAAVAVFAGFAITWQAGIATEEESDGVSALVVTADGSVRCGELQTNDDGTLVLIVGEKALGVQDGNGVDVIEECPP